MQVDAGASGEQAAEPAAHQTPGAALRAPAAAAAVPGTSAPPPSAAPATGAHATPADALAGAGGGGGPWRSLPTPATQVRQQLSAHMLRLAAQLDGPTVEPLLAKAHQASLQGQGLRERWGGLQGGRRCASQAGTVERLGVGPLAQPARANRC